jgi:hypothetical protein
MNDTPLDFLKAVYCNADLPLSVRLRPAIEAAPYVHPKRLRPPLSPWEESSRRG